MLNYLRVVAIRKYIGIEGEKGKEEKGSEKHRKEKEQSFLKYKGELLFLTLAM